MDLVKTLTDGAAVFGVTLDEKAVSRLFTFKELLHEGNQRMNLTAIENDEHVIVKHFLDSLSAYPMIARFAHEESSGIPKAAAGTLLRVIDIGTGAGFPGIPLKIAAEAFMSITLLDSLEKRVGFLSEIIGTLALTDIRAYHGRAEEFGIRAGFREGYDIALARAVASLPVLLEYCLPFVKVGGLFIAMKGGKTKEELASSGKALDELGGVIERVWEFCLPGTDINRQIITVKKFRHTPTKYPRKPGKPAKLPIVSPEWRADPAKT